MTTLVKPVTFLFGAVLTIVGIAGFFLAPNGMLLGLFEVNALHNVIHILSGVVGLWAASSGHAYARMYLIVFGLVYALVTVLGFVLPGGDFFGLMRVNMYDNYLHAAIAVVTLAVGFGSKK
jgi:hypothetical protein